MDERFTVVNGHQRLNSFHNRSPMLSPNLGVDGQLSPSINSSSSAIQRSKSDLDMSRLVRQASNSNLSYNSQSTRSEQFMNFKDEKQSGMRQLFARSSRLLQKRKSSNRLRTMEWADTESTGSGSDASSRKSMRSSRFLSPRVDAPPRPFISDPYNFKHLTHTGPQQAKVLQSTDQRQLVSEFSAIRAAQAPKPELKGIKADDIIPQYSVDDFSPRTSRSNSPTSPNANRHTLRSVKSVDSFTRFASGSFSSPHPPVCPPPRLSSKQTQRLSGTLVLGNIDTSLASNVKASSPTHSPTSYFNHKESPISTQEIAQAVTTPDDSALLFITHNRTHSSIALLADVPEEEEEAARLERRESKSRDLRHSKSFPVRVSLTQPAFPGPQFCEEEDIPARFSRCFSNTPAQTSWEDDIDYCYEHAMEAFGLDEKETTNDEATSEANGYTNPYLQKFAIDLSTTNDSAASSAISVPGIATPADATPSHDTGLFPLSPSLLIPKEYSSRSPPEESYQHRLAADMDTKLDSFYYAPSTTGMNSARNSGISKFSSRESLSTRATSVITGSKHRQSSSIGSIPDLLPPGISKNVGAADHPSHQRSTSVDSVKLLTPSTLPPPLPTTTTRKRSNSDGANKLLDLAMIGAPAPATRSRAGSMAMGKPRSTARASYSLFPASSPTLPQK